jgi:mannose-6-phosphate isomerase-like protein (cupin superfamily)
VKELTIDPGQSLSMQRHMFRTEDWLITEGRCTVKQFERLSGQLIEQQLDRHQRFHVTIEAWHQLSNPYDQPCRIVELQYGARCSESDIERRE